MSVRDTSVLNRLFDAEASPNASTIIDPGMPEDPHIQNGDVLARLRGQEAASIRLIETTLSRIPHDGLVLRSKYPEIDEAIAALTSVIATYPDYASGYVNRAQALRIKYGDHIFSSSLPSSNTMFADLNRSIDLATPQFPESPVSPSQARVLANAHALRGTLIHTLSKDLPALQDKQQLPAFLCGRTAENLEELGSRDFALGGKYGNEIAKAMAIQTNTYAKMCGKIVQEAMRKEYKS
ncbi:hypothetical protein MMC12_003810 [Toensbergia leucococca]|nr:hypothetical protein [Toensbergia leucococca]